MTETEIQNILEKQHKFFPDRPDSACSLSNRTTSEIKRFYHPPRTGSESCLKSRPWKKRDGKLYV